MTVRCHRVHRLSKILPGAGNAVDVGLTAKLTFVPDFTGDARNFGGERDELVHHCVDGVLQLEDFAADIDRDFAG